MAPTCSFGVKKHSYKWLRNPDYNFINIKK